MRQAGSAAAASARMASAKYLVRAYGQERPVGEGEGELGEGEGEGSRCDRSSSLRGRPALALEP